MLLGSPPSLLPRSAKNFGSRRVEFEALMCGGICVKFLAAISLEIEGENLRRKSQKFRCIFRQHFQIDFPIISPEFRCGELQA